MSVRILIIDDEERLRNNIEELLELSGYNVTTAEDGKSGIEAINSIHPDLILQNRPHFRALHLHY